MEMCELDAFRVSESPKKLLADMLWETDRWIGCRTWMLQKPVKLPAAVERVDRARHMTAKATNDACDRLFRPTRQHKRVPVELADVVVRTTKGAIARPVILTNGDGNGFGVNPHVAAFVERMLIRETKGAPAWSMVRPGFFAVVSQPDGRRFAVVAGVRGVGSADENRGAQS